MSVSKAYHIISSESIAVSCERLRPGRVETVYKSPANCLLFMTHVQQKLAGRSVVLAAPGRPTCSGGRKTPMYRAASSGQHHARVQAFPVQDPLGAPEDPGAARPRTQLVSRRLRFATRAHVQASSRKTHQNINDRQLLNDYDYSGMWVAMTIETVLQFRHPCLRC